MASSFSQTDKFNTRMAISRQVRKFNCGKHKDLKHKDFLLFRNCNNFLKFSPRILFLMIKSQSAKGVGQPSQKEFLLCDHRSSPSSPQCICKQHLTAQPSLRTGIQAHVTLDSLPSSSADQRPHWEESWQMMHSRSGLHWYWSVRDRWREKAGRDSH